MHNVWNYVWIPFGRSTLYSLQSVYFHQDTHAQTTNHNKSGCCVSYSEFVIDTLTSNLVSSPTLIFIVVHNIHYSSFITTLGIYWCSQIRTSTYKGYRFIHLYMYELHIHITFVVGITIKQFEKLLSLAPGVKIDVLP